MSVAPLTPTKAKNSNKISVKILFITSCYMKDKNFDEQKKLKSIFGFAISRQFI